METTFVKTIDELRELFGYPQGRAVTKERKCLHEADRQWLAAAPFCVVATADEYGNCDASPKGDPAGHLVHVLDDSTIAIAERPGNKRADGYVNVLSNPHAGIISMVPGRNDTLRINGRASLVREAPFFDQMIVRGSRPILALVIDVEQVFYHCAKAFMRAALWQPETWDASGLPSMACRTKMLQDTPETLAELEEYYEDANYRKKLYLSGSAVRRDSKGRFAMKYLLLVCVDPDDLPENAPADVEPWVKEMSERGIRLFGHQLHPPSDATTVKVRDGELLASDGPYAETKEWMAGFDIIDCENLDDAIAVAAANPMAAWGMIEIRPFWPTEFTPVE